MDTGHCAVAYSIESTYFHSISTDFHKLSNLLWEQRVVSSNLTAPTIHYSLPTTSIGLVAHHAPGTGRRLYPSLMRLFFIGSSRA